MKIKGQSPAGIEPQIIIIPRQAKIEQDSEGNWKQIPQDIVFKAAPVLDYGDFDKLCPPPLPPKKLLPGGERQENIEHPDFKKAVLAYNRRRINWTVIKSLEATDDLEWERIKKDDPSTWDLLEQELEESGLIRTEVVYLITEALNVNIVSEEKVELARKRFLAGAPDHNGESTTLKDVLVST